MSVIYERWQTSFGQLRPCVNVARICRTSFSILSNFLETLSFQPQNRILEMSRSFWVTFNIKNQSSYSVLLFSWSVLNCKTKISVWRASPWPFSLWLCLWFMATGDDWNFLWYSVVEFLHSQEISHRIFLQLVFFSSKFPMILSNKCFLRSAVKLFRTCVSVTLQQKLNCRF